MNTDSNTLFGIIRHGKTQWNLEKRIQGKNDPPLCPEGIAQVQKWGTILGKVEKWDRIVTSSLQRSWETAGIINERLKLPTEKDKGLDEQDWGAWNGKTKKDLMARHLPELKYQMSLGWRFCPPEGEDRLSVWQRSRKTLWKMARRFPGQKILVVTHSGVIRILVYGVLKKTFIPGESPLLKPYHLHILEWENNDLIIKSLNDLECQCH